MTKPQIRQLATTPPVSDATARTGGVYAPDRASRSRELIGMASAWMATASALIGTAYVAAFVSFRASLVITLPVLAVVGGLVSLMAARVRSARERERDRFKATIEALSTALTARDGYTGEHSHETLSLCAAVCAELGLAESDCRYIADVALLHDIGKIGIPNDILHAPGKLTAEQWAVMKEHPVIGERIVARVPGLELVARAIRHEHERWDGSGYPDGLTAADIPLASRIVLACDAYHAMTSERPYRRSIGRDAAREELRLHSGTQFDPAVVSALLTVTEESKLRTYAAQKVDQELARLGSPAV